MWVLREVDGPGVVCLFCRKYTGPKFLDNGFDAICLDCANEIAKAMMLAKPEPEAKRSRKKGVLSSV